MDMNINSQVYYAGSGNEIGSALDDIKRSLINWRVWCTLGWNDILAGYRRSFIGPFWITLQTATWALAIGIVYGLLFGQDMRTFLPHVATGIVMWSLIGNLVNESTVAFSHSSPYLLQAQTPKATFLARVLVRQLITFLHNAVIILGCIIWADLPIGFEIIFALFGLILVFFTGAGVGLVVATIGVRFRDLAPAVQSILQIMFFLTPVMWKPEMLPGKMRFFIADWNPFAAMIDVVRGPLLSQPVSAQTWFFAMVVSCVTLIVGFFVFAKYRKRIAYWL
jgi:homopolymeric O-antigen transport system permease protein